MIFTGVLVFQGSVYYNLYYAIRIAKSYYLWVKKPKNFPQNFI